MNSKFSRPEMVLVRIAGWASPALFISSVIVTWWLHDKHELFLRWIEIEKYIALICIGLQTMLVGLVVRKRSIPGSILILLGGLFLLGFVMFAQPWLLLAALGISSAGGLLLVMPQLRDIYHRLSNSYREISASSKM
jgi:hypothetical protein